jgi:hypothetical protein
MESVLDLLQGWVFERRKLGGEYDEATKIETRLELEPCGTLTQEDWTFV